MKSEEDWTDNHDDVHEEVKETIIELRKLNKLQKKILKNVDPKSLTNDK